MPPKLKGSAVLVRIDAHCESSLCRLFYNSNGTSLGASTISVSSQGAYLTMETDRINIRLTQLITIQIAIIMIPVLIRGCKRLGNHPDRENPNALKTFPDQLMFHAAAIASESFATFLILSVWVRRGADTVGIEMQQSSAAKFSIPHTPCSFSSIRSNSARCWAVLLLVCCNCSFKSSELSGVELAKTDTCTLRS